MNPNGCRGVQRVPSVLGGTRPAVRDPAADTRRRIAFMAAEQRTTKEKLERLERELTQARAELAAMQERCGHCGNCSACGE